MCNVSTDSLENVSLFKDISGAVFVQHVKDKSLYVYKCSAIKWVIENCAESSFNTDEIGTGFVDKMLPTAETYAANKDIVDDFIQDAHEFTSIY